MVLDEAQWVLRARDGEEHSMSLLIERHRGRLVRTASNILRDANEAEDVAQEAFLKAFRELDRLRDDQAFSGYIYRICVRLCMDRLRARRAEPAEFESATADQGEAIENRVMIERLLDRLPHDLRVTLVLREVEQLSYDEIAEVLRVPVGTVRSRLHAAREKFRALWTEAVG
ncbi:MAG: sigma-70 family RNA polymerase sigma factor [Fimbriimonadales bacterium]